jgi:nucleotide-binding universal stress UspA family protein
MKRYLVPYDGSHLAKSALDHAARFSRTVPGALEIVHIADVRAMANPVIELTVMALQGIGTLGDLIPREQAILELKTRLIARGEDLLNEAIKTTELEGVTYSARVEPANPPAFIIEVSENYDLIFLGLRGEMWEFKAGMWGGTSEAVIRKGRAPVFVATSQYRPFNRIIVGFDNRPRSRQALAWAGMIAENISGHVDVVTAGGDEKNRERILSEARSFSDSYRAEFSYISAGEHPAKAILDAASDKPDSLICLGAFGDEPVREFFLGSVAEEVLRKSESPVLLLK